MAWFGLQMAVFFSTNSTQMQWLGAVNYKRSTLAVWWFGSCFIYQKLKPYWNWCIFCGLSHLSGFQGLKYSPSSFWPRVSKHEEKIRWKHKLVVKVIQRPNIRINPQHAPKDATVVKLFKETYWCMAFKAFFYLIIIYTPYMKHKLKAISAKLWTSWESYKKVLNKSWKRSEEVLGKFWEIPEKFLRMSGKNPQRVLRKSRESLKKVFGKCLESPETVLLIKSLKSTVKVLRKSWESKGKVLIISREVMRKSWESLEKVLRKLVKVPRMS